MTNSHPQPVVTSRTERGTHVRHLRFSFEMCDRIAEATRAGNYFSESECVRAMLSSGLAVAERKAQ